MTGCSALPVHALPVSAVQPRSDVHVRFPDGRTFGGPVGTPLKDFTEAAAPGNREIVAGLIDGHIVELGKPIVRDTEVSPITTFTSNGLRIYQRTAHLVLLVAMRELYPEARTTIDHSVTLDGFFCKVTGRPTLNQEELDALSDRMQQIIQQDLPISAERLPVARAVEVFAAQGYDDKVRLLSGHEQEQITVHALRGTVDCLYGPLLPTTGRLGPLTLESSPPGFILRAEVPAHQLPLESHTRYPKLMGVFREYGSWLDILGIEDVGALNQVIQRGEGARAVLVSEALQEKQISRIADAILARDTVQVVLIAGPSSSGKSTFVRRLGVQLLVNSRKQLALGLDDYFVDRADTPVNADGTYDFEALEAVNLELFNQQVQALMRGERVTIPRFDFIEGRGIPDREVQLSPGALVLIEGIHGLNPELLVGIPEERIFRVYVSALTQLNLDRHNRVSTTDNRLLRRMVRDDATRGISAVETLRRWPSVRQGEERYIFPYQENADVMFNSALAYEIAVLKPFVERLLLRVSHTEPEVTEAERLLNLLHWVQPLDAALVPSNSLLREFVGGSILS
ncbi:MAG: nucleoside kinase [Anaerolineae bacterium]|jgi:uridine kinase